MDEAEALREQMVRNYDCCTDIDYCYDYNEHLLTRAYTKREIRYDNYDKLMWLNDLMYKELKED